MRLKIRIDGGNRNTSVSDFDDEVGKFKPVTDGACGGCHVSWEPIDESSAGVEVHFS